MIQARVIVGLLVPVLVTLTHPGPGAGPSEAGETGLVDLAPESVQDDFRAGIVALHDFWYGEAADRFRAVQEGAPDFALGYWGEAMSLHQNPFGHVEPPIEEMRTILERFGPTRDARARRIPSEPERAYLNALEILIDANVAVAERHRAYVAAMEALATRFPRDIEARAFYARSILLEEASFSRSRPTQERTAAVARQVLEMDPDHHGGLHYLIHGLDRPLPGAEAVRAADRYRGLAAGASHAVHMPSHIYMQLGRWDDVIDVNRNALAASEAWIERTGRTEASLDGHAVDFLHYALLQQGRNREALEIVERFDGVREETGSGAMRWFSGIWHARQELESGASMADEPYRSGYAPVAEWVAVGLYAAQSSHIDRARAVRREIQARIETDDSVEWRIADRMIGAAIDLVEGRGARAIPSLLEAIEWQSEMPRPNEAPDLAKPPEELLGEVYSAIGRNEDAIRAFDATEMRWPGRLATRVGRARAYALLGDRERATFEYGRVQEQLRRASPDHRVRVEAERYMDAGSFSMFEALSPATLPEVEKVGNGPVPLIVIPCMSCRWRSFDTFMERNSERYTQYAVTLPGFGATPQPDLPEYGAIPAWQWNAVAALSRLLDSEDLHEVVVLGHSFGAHVAMLLAAARPDRVRALINVDGTLTSDRSWFSNAPEDRWADAEGIVRTWAPRLADAEYWRQFNGSSRSDPDRRALYHGMFMATDPDVLLQYWRENALVDLNPVARALDMPVLDMKAISRSVEDREAARADYLADLERNGITGYTTLFFFDTGHYIMEERPEAFDRVLDDFLSGRPLRDIDGGGG